MEHALTPFEGTEIRKVWHNEEWYFSVIDVIGFLSNATNPASYWNKVQKNILSDSQLLPFWQKLKLVGQDGKARPSDCANTEGILRIVMSVPSPKAEPLKLWLAKVGNEYIQETENPELSFERMTEIYRAKGRSDEWIKERLQSISTRKLLTDEWKNRGVQEGQEFSILTATISKGTFGLTPTEHSQLKGLEKQNLRDHMTPLELILTSFGEEVTRQIAINDEAKGFNENHDAATKGGALAGQARLNVENQLKKSVISSENFLTPNNDKDKPTELGEGVDYKV
jgi:DNA-damage-inducible protein D